MNFPGYTGDGADGVRAFGEFWRAFWATDASYRSYLDLTDPYGDTKDFVTSVGTWTAVGAKPAGTVKADKLTLLSATPTRVAFVVCADETRLRANGRTGWGSHYKMRIVMSLTDGWRVSRFQSLPAKECGR
ncbi:hypothetical protein ACIBG8_23685 [Nonomuraea sp. NPDC050556]|uniref:hypothetical protein n=1 Tax=Nonomuraea sp. NPDC050556 TaxID=3364369 RepID=UPI0037A01FCD